MLASGVLTFIGGLFVLYQLWRFGLFLVYELGAKGHNLVRRYKGSESGRSSGDLWAVVTGATSGIGLAYAHELAKRGFSVLLVSRSEEKLNSVRDEIIKATAARNKDGTPVGVKCCVADFSSRKGCDAGLAAVKSSVADMDVCILVNNVGVNVDYPCEITEISETKIDQLIEVNCRCTAQMTRMFVPIIGARTQKHKGGIVTLGSYSGLTGAPLLSVYSATKAFDHILMQALAPELESIGIDVLSVNPLMVVSEMSKIRRPSFFQPRGDVVASTSLRQLGVTALPWWSSGYFAHTIQEFFLLNGPVRFVQSKLLGLHKDIKRRALKKLEKES